MAPEGIDIAFRPTRHVHLTADEYDLGKGLNCEVIDLPQLDVLLASKWATEARIVLNEYSALKHIKLTLPQYSIKSWDLPFKRTLAVHIARRIGAKRVLLIDDDIIANRSGVHQAAALLSSHDTVSIRPTSFPDKSTVGHVARMLGKDHDVFMSGACMLLNTANPLPMFPAIYNEDWLFVLFQTLERIAASGEALQAPYNPFTVRRACFQELGDLFAEHLLATYMSGDRATLARTVAWKHALEMRRAYLESLLRMAQVLPSMISRCLLASLNTLSAFDPSRLAQLFRALRDDQKRWIDESISL